MNPLVSIAIVSFNRPKDLRRALASAVGQTYRELEILVTDASTLPEVAEILQEFARADSRVKVFHHDQDPGFTASFNFILHQAHGEFFMWLADDDWLAPEAIELLSAALVANPRAVIASSAVNFYLQDALASSSPPHHVPGATPAARVLSYCRTVTHNSIIFGLNRRSNLAGLTLNNELSHDGIFMAKVVARGFVATVDQPVFLRSFGGTSASIERIIKARNIPIRVPRNLYRHYGNEIFCSLLRDRRQLPELNFLQVCWIALCAGGLYWYRGTVSGSGRAKLKSWLAPRPRSGGSPPPA